MGAAGGAARAVDGPVYLRMKRPDAGAPIGASRALTSKGEVLRAGRAGTIIASGITVAAALEAAETLAAEGIEAGVVNIATVKPLDEALVIASALETGVIVVAENHSITGGLGSAVAETLLEAGVPAAFTRVGIMDRFAEGGSTPYLQAKYGLDATAIVAGFRRALAKRAGAART
jgi:transketolase